jgi:stage II sporulation protein R
MGGVFMLKILKTLLVCGLVIGVLWLAGVVRDRNTLDHQIIRLHIVAASDSKEDQALKLQVRDAVNAYLSEDMADCNDVDEAYVLLSERLEEIRLVAQQVLDQAGAAYGVQVSLKQEEFDTRYYDTFALPAGVYDSLRIVIGQGQGHNWWCVVFPRLCLSTTTDDFVDTAVGSGFSDTLTDTIGNKKGYEVRFFILDCLGMIQNFFNRG